MQYFHPAHRKDASYVIESHHKTTHAHTKAPRGEDCRRKSSRIFTFCPCAKTSKDSERERESMRPRKFATQCWAMSEMFAAYMFANANVLTLLTAAAAVEEESVHMCGICGTHSRLLCNSRRTLCNHTTEENMRTK